MHPGEIVWSLDGFVGVNLSSSTAWQLDLLASAAEKKLNLDCKTKLHLGYQTSRFRMWISLPLVEFATSRFIYSPELKESGVSRQVL